MMREEFDSVKRDILCLLSISLLFLSLQFAALPLTAQTTGSIAGWGDRVVVPFWELEGHVALAGGRWHSLGLKADGSIMAWGDNGYGQCDVPEPNADFVAVAGGFAHSLGLKADGSIAAWGDNEHGQCDIPAPNASFAAIAAGADHNLGLKVRGGPFLVAGAGPAPANPPLVRMFPPEQDAEPVLEFSAYEASGFGVNVATGDLDNDGLDEVLTGAGPGAIYGPHVRGFAVDGTPLLGLSFFAYGTHKYGVNVAAGNLDGQASDVIVTGAGPGAVFGPHVRAFAYDPVAQTVAPVPGVSFLAYGTHKWGVNVTAGDIDGDGCDEIVTAPGPASMFGAHIRGWNYDGSAITPLPGCSFFAWPAAEARFGARVFAGADLDWDGRDEIVVGGGPDPAVDSPVKVYRYNGVAVTYWFSLTAFPPDLTQGTNVAAGRF